ncbi:hypothetical protein [Uliginosibacterium sp. H1]|uniref:hypothetical protein n=1 Tax=Uliginosibacterium sp. H1 TaxID=3114757 RepID=UPI002E171EA0|nr:hypothetical protein [Uliginosibacterium sp. H1]
MITWEEAEQDAAYSQFVEEVAQQAVDEHAEEQLRKFYLGNRSLAQPGRSFLAEGDRVVSASPTSAVLLYTTAIEVGIKKAILEPVICGVVHSEPLASLISEAVIRQAGIDRYKDLLNVLFSEYLGTEFHTLRLGGRVSTMWDDVMQTQKARNRVAHRAELATPEEAQLAGRLAKAVNFRLVESMANRCGLRIDPDGLIAGA